MINRFEGDNAFLNNFWSCPIIYDGMSFLNIGQAFVASKTSDRAERFGISHIGTAREIMAYSYKMPPRSLDVELEIMKDLMRRKFSYPNMASLLIKTIGHELIDGRDWISNPADLVWSYDLKRDKGENNHGKLLMQIRSEL